jgi:hypothetical protein
MPRTKKQIEESLARLDARYRRLEERAAALRKEFASFAEKQRAILQSKARLQKQLTLPREDREKRTIVETTVAQVTSRRVLTAEISPDGRTATTGGYWLRCGKGRYAVGDPIEILFRWKKAIGGAGRWEFSIVQRKPYAVERMHEVTGYDA